MEFRPCIDIHNGVVKQIVGSSLKDEGNKAAENFIAEESAAFFSGIYKEKNLTGGHVIILNSADSEYYEASKKAAFEALNAFRGGMQAGGGINAENAREFLDAGASHVIVTSYVFKDGRLNYDNLNRLTAAVGKERVVLDLSCRIRDGNYYVVTDRWQKFTEMVVNAALFEELSGYCDEFLVHAVDVEGKSGGIDKNLIEILSDVQYTVTYAGGVRDLSDIEKVKAYGRSRINVTVGSALKLFGGKLELDDIAKLC
ncbi:MAG: phosphoribosylformimino-5-aminoimidazole carboxamide ribotide isomerase [Lachnospiraceae bacterium]|nr:phosphoribosylformimino-5-aminoimidazole carboxamide ribotide isomerase [Lachnospiraceae bacterium]